MNKKQFAVAILFATVLLTVSFIPISSQQIGTYDPWADINGDGKIDIWDLAYSAKAYGTTGDPTKNVTVTNFPLDKEGNLKVSSYSQGIFAESLILRGTVATMMANVAGTNIQCFLIDNHTPFPKILPQTYLETSHLDPWTVWGVVYDTRFIYESLPQRSYYIQGKVFVTLRYSIWQSGGTMGIQGRGTLYFERIFVNGTIETLGEVNMGESYLSVDSTPLEAGITLPFETPVLIGQGERIAVRLTIETRNTGNGGIFYFRHYYCMNDASSDLLVIVPLAY